MHEKGQQGRNKYFFRDHRKQRTFHEPRDRFDIFVDLIKIHGFRLQRVTAMYWYGLARRKDKRTDVVSYVIVLSHRRRIFFFQNLGIVPNAVPFLLFKYRYRVSEILSQKTNFSIAMKDYPMTSTNFLLDKINFNINFLLISKRISHGANDGRQTTARVDAEGRG